MWIKKQARIACKKCMLNWVGAVTTSVLLESKEKIYHSPGVAGKSNLYVLTNPCTVPANKRPALQRLRRAWCSLPSCLSAGHPHLSPGRENGKSVGTLYKMWKIVNKKEPRLSRGSFYISWQNSFCNRMFICRAAAPPWRRDR